ncbi:MAG: UbiD family decarboxylase [Candidatus Caldarchaeum sp.]|nr:UbiD family decarboxylase [Candidatus Caldarchaeum sp.]
MKDLRWFMTHLRTKSPDLYIETEAEINPFLEVTAVIGKLEKIYGIEAPLLYFKNVRGSEHGLVCNVYNGYRKVSTAMGLEVEQPWRLLEEYVKRKRSSVMPKEVSDGPCKEVILKGERINVAKFPIVTTSPKDDAPYLTTAVTVSRDVENHEFPNYNLGIYRHRLIDKNRIGLYYSWGKFIHYLHRKAEDRNQPFEVALAIGLNPLITISATDQNHGHEYELAGSLIGEPVELVKCETVDLHVPADSEIVIEGVIHPGARQREGPYGEYPGYYGHIVDAPMIQITCITHREDAIYQHASSGGHAENVFFLGWEADLLTTLKKYYPTVKAVHMPFYVAPYLCFISMRKVNEGDPVSVGVAAAGLQQFAKYIVVVDDDVNIFDVKRVLWAVTTRSRFDEDVVVVPRSKGNRLDPTTYTRMRDSRDSMVTKMVIDATRKTGLPYEIPEPVEEPLVDAVDLEKLGISRKLEQAANKV